MDRLDCQGISQLMDNGFSFQDSIALLETDKNMNCFQEIRHHMEQGEDPAGYFEQICPKAYRKYLMSFICYLPFQLSLSLSIDIYDQEQRALKEIERKLFYPCLLFISSISGILLFIKFCFPPMLSMMSGFHTDLSGFMNLKVFAVIAEKMIILTSLCIPIIFMLLRKPENQIRSYTFLSRHFPNSTIVLIQSVTFIRFFEQCLRRNISTRESIMILKSLFHKPIVAYMAQNVETELLEGNTFEQAMHKQCFDPSLTRFLRIAIYASNMQNMLRGYIVMSEGKINRQLNRFALSIQLVTYAMIGIVIVFIYQILLMPLSIMIQLEGEHMKKGFTLLEMIIVISIISILFLLTVPNIQKVLGIVQKKGCDALVKVVDSAIVQYRLEYDENPGSINDLVNAGLLTDEQTRCDEKSISVTGGQASAQ